MWLGESSGEAGPPLMRTAGSSAVVCVLARRARLASSEGPAGAP